jgi:hypothetical protein
MKAEHLISIGLFTLAAVLTYYAWCDRLAHRNPAIEEAFEDSGPGISQADIDKLVAANEPRPTADDAEKAYKTLLLFIRNDFSTGAKYVLDFGQRFFGSKVQIRSDLDSRTLMDNYRSPTLTF